MPLPTTEDALRDLVAAAWLDGWHARRRLIGRTRGVMAFERPLLLNAFLRRCGLPRMSGQELFHMEQSDAG